MARWHFGLDPSAIQDGTYTDIHRGQQLEFAVVFRLESWDRAPERETAAARAEGRWYDIVARVDAIGHEAWVLECGLPVAATGRPPAGLEVGQWVRGRIGLEVSPQPAQLLGPGLPPLVRTWFVERVHHRTGPDDLQLPDFGLHGGAEEPGWEELAFTDAWRDDDGRAEYLVECLEVNG